MRSVSLLAILAAALLVAVVPLAFASPPDPLWIPGIYDAGDSDDGLFALMDERLALADHRIATMDVVWTSQRRLPGATFPVATETSRTVRPRSPPAD